MRTSSILLKGFRCFPAEGQLVELNDLTCLVGPNASGKTAMMAGLARIFGESQSDRVVRSSDFHLSPGETLDAQKERHLTLEATLALPELEENEPSADSIPEVFNQMVVDEPGATPFCRVRLEATWTDDGTADGDVQQKLSWILTASDDPKVVEANRRAVRPAERSRIRVVYVPATRDPSSQIRATTASLFGRLLKAIDWAGKDDEVRRCLATLKTELGQLAGISTMNANVQTIWSKLYDGRVASNLTFEGVEAEPRALLDLLTPTFAPDERGQSFQYTELSDGLRALFALSLPLGLYRVEELLKTDAASSGFQSSVADEIPLLTLFAVEEPENHLSPHYLGKVVLQLLEVARSDTAQVVLSSHSPAIVGRVEPDNVRYFLGGEEQTSTTIRGLALPTDSADEAFKYVREAVRGHPELYFARLVILGEGPSEEIILRKLFESSGAPLDTHFISVVPLGGRHVNHFWRLLHGLGIPYFTLLDLDREKEGAGWGRVQYVRNQLIDLHGPHAVSLQFDTRDGGTASLEDESYANLSKNDDRSMVSDLSKWIDFLRTKFDVFFSVPLDIDLAMLESFPDAYKAQAPSSGGPRLPDTEPDRSAAVQDRLRLVLAADPQRPHPDLGSSYSENQVQLFPWYKYLFVDGSKPVAHMRTLLELNGTNWVERVPETLKLLLQRARSIAGGSSMET